MNRLILDSLIITLIIIVIILILNKNTETTQKKTKKVRFKDFPYIDSEKQKQDSFIIQNNRINPYQTRIGEKEAINSNIKWAEQEEKLRKSFSHNLSNLSISKISDNILN